MAAPNTSDLEIGHMVHRSDAEPSECGEEGSGVQGPGEGVSKWSAVARAQAGLRSRAVLQCPGRFYGARGAISSLKQTPCY